MDRRAVLTGGAALLASACASTGGQAVAKPIIIAHRGASGDRPEHTRAAYELAIAQGADFIEPDLVITKDGVLICRHENELSGTTDIAAHAAFANRRATKVIDGSDVTGWFAEDFTFEELSQLRCKERIPELRPANVAYDGQEPILRFSEALAIARANNVGIYPELKHPSFLIACGLDPVPLFVAAVNEACLNAADAPIFAQCFEVGTLERLKQLSPIRRIQLVSGLGGPADKRDVRYLDMLTPAGLAAIAGYADGIGAEKNLVIPRDASNAMTTPSSLVRDAHRAGLLVHCWTFRAENAFLPTQLRAAGTREARGDLASEVRAFLAAGVDGVFSDQPGIAAAARS
jgi:glycerophosphoryl diester phosphodiesterase